MFLGYLLHASRRDAERTSYVLRHEMARLIEPGYISITLWIRFSHRVTGQISLTMCESIPRFAWQH